MENNDSILPLVVSAGAVIFWLLVCVVDSLATRVKIRNAIRKLDATGGQPTYRETHSEHGEDYPSD